MVEMPSIDEGWEHIQSPSCSFLSMPSSSHPSFPVDLLSPYFEPDALEISAENENLEVLEERDETKDDFKTTPSTPKDSIPEELEPLSKPLSFVEKVIFGATLICLMKSLVFSDLRSLYFALKTPPYDIGSQTKATPALSTVTTTKWETVYTQLVTTTNIVIHPTVTMTTTHTATATATKSLPTPTDTDPPTPKTAKQNSKKHSYGCAPNIPQRCGYLRCQLMGAQNRLSSPFQHQHLRRLPPPAPSRPSSKHKGLPSSGCSSARRWLFKRRAPPTC
ncbi:hypothetical protein CC78DRAFT_581321 [Lojkania enalia]|uniref:Uncharacterized protein n=1 Tax=Lojkania enalia TaxID=147567 RepID=A0A9P4KBV4_9PLEO|nr:hypothetical protein CC78DRAFT_581321 [Didymosphaeria enalia]